MSAPTPSQQRTWDLFVAIAAFTAITVGVVDIHRGASLWWLLLVLANAFNLAIKLNRLIFGGKP